MALYGTDSEYTRGHKPDKKVTHRVAALALLLVDETSCKLVEKNRISPGRGEAGLKEPGCQDDSHM